MLRRILTVPIAALIALAPFHAAWADDLPSLLIAPAGSGWSANDAEAMSAEDIVTEYDSQSQAEVRGELSDDGFRAGFRRDWQQPGSDGPQLEERVFAFKQWFGPSAWFASTKGDYESDPTLKSKYSSSVPNSFACYLQDSNGVYTVEQFFRGPYFFELTMTTSATPSFAAVQAVAQAIFAHTPGSITPLPTAPLTDLAVTGVSITGGLVIIGAVVLVVVLRRRRRAVPAPPAPGTFFSPDGNWWWDGTQWLPSGRAAAPPSQRPG